MTKPHPGRGGDGVRKVKPGRDGKARWIVRLYWRDERTGEERERRATVTAASKSLALSEREKLLAQAMGGTPAASARRKFADVATEAVSGIKRHGTRKTSESWNRHMSRHFGTWFIDKVTPRDIESYLEAVSAPSAKNMRAALNRVFRHALKRGYIATNPMRDVVVERRETSLEDVQPEATKALEIAQVAAYFADLEANELDLYPLVHTQFMLGCRFAEVSALYRTDLDLESGLVQILRGQYLGVIGPPKGNAARVAALPLATRALLRAHLDRMAVEQWPGWETLVFPRPPTSRVRKSDFWSHATVHAKIKSSFFRLDIRMGASTHVARYTMVTVASQVSASEALTRAVTGHKSIAVHRGYQQPESGKIVQLAGRVGGAMLGGRTGAKTGASKRATRGDAGKQGSE